MTAVKRTGVEVIAWAAACAEGVAIARTRSYPEANFEAMDVVVA